MKLKSEDKLVLKAIKKCDNAGINYSTNYLAKKTKLTASQAYAAQVRLKRGKMI